MKKILTIVFALFAFVAQADNVITSKEYVDAQASSLQEQIGANDANTVLTYTDTAGTVGEKKIYDSSATYAGQTDALVTAGAFNTAIQNALETEFVCIDWLGDVHDNAHCLLYQIRTATPKPGGKNLFDLNGTEVLFTQSGIQVIKTANGYAITNTVGGNRAAAVKLGDIEHFFGKTLTISQNATCTGDAMPFVGLILCDSTGENRTYTNPATLTVPDTSDGIHTKVAFRLYANGNGSCTYSNIQVEEGAVATEYEPYQNLYLPSGN